MVGQPNTTRDFLILASDKSCIRDELFVLLQVCHCNRHHWSVRLAQEAEGASGLIFRPNNSGSSAVAGTVII
jgi:hypothetical protein